MLTGAGSSSVLYPRESGSRYVTQLKDEGGVRIRGGEARNGLPIRFGPDGTARERIRRGGGVGA